MLIPIFTIHFLRARFNKAQLPCGLNSYIILYFIILSMTQAHATYWGKLRKCGLKGMDRFLSNLLHEPSLCVLPSGKGTLVAPLAHGGGFVPEISTPKQLLCTGWLWPNFRTLCMSPAYACYQVGKGHW